MLPQAQSENAEPKVSTSVGIPLNAGLIHNSATSLPPVAAGRRRVLAVKIVDVVVAANEMRVLGPSHPPTPSSRTPKSPWSHSLCGTMDGGECFSGLHGEFRSDALRARFSTFFYKIPLLNFPLNCLADRPETPHSITSAVSSPLARGSTSSAPLSTCSTPQRTPTCKSSSLSRWPFPHLRSKFPPQNLAYFFSHILMKFAARAGAVLSRFDATDSPSPKAGATHALPWAEEFPTDTSHASLVSPLTFGTSQPVSNCGIGSLVRTLPSRRLAARLSGVQEQVALLRARIAGVTAPDSMSDNEGSLSYSLSSDSSRYSESDDVWMPEMRVEAVASKPVAPLNLLEAARKHDDCKRADVQAARKSSLGNTESVREQLFSLHAPAPALLPAPLHACKQLLCMLILSRAICLADCKYSASCSAVGHSRK